MLTKLDTKITEGIELLESFKTYKFSADIDETNLKVFAALRSAKLNPEVAKYFTNLPIDPAINDLEPTPVNAAKIKTILNDYYSKMPLTGFGDEPDNVTQIKKLLNALHYAHTALLKLEKLELRNGYINDGLAVYALYKDTIDDTYEACYLLTHMDVDVQEMFQEELQLLTPAMATLNKFVEKNSEQTKLFAKNIQNYPLSYKVGEVTGTAIEQMRPSSGSLDYGFLTQFSALLPGYIDKITQYVEQYSSQLIAQEPTLNNAKLEELQNSARALLNDLESLRNKNSYFLSFKVINYIHILSNIITLSKSSLEQIGHLSESSQDVIRTNLAQLKYQLFPQLFGLVDKIELNCLLKPGTLSNPLMEKVKPLYDTLIYYAKKPVNFEERGEELLTIEDSRFVALRLEKTYQRIDNANKALLQIKRAEDAGARFYEIIKEHRHKNKNLGLNQLPQEVKSQLIEYYKIIKPYMAQADADSNNLIIHSLNGSTGKNVFSRALNWVVGSPPDDLLDVILVSKMAFNNLIKKKTNTQEFHIKLNNNLIDSVLKTTNLTLYPYNDTTSVITAEQLEKVPAPTFEPENPKATYRIDETIPLEKADENNTEIKFVGDDKLKTVSNPEDLSADQSLVLYQWYKDKTKRLEEANTAYQQFFKLLAEQIKEHSIQPHILNFNQLPEPSKQQLRDLYQQVRTHFLASISPDMHMLAHSFDKFLHPSPSTGLHLVPPVLAEFAKLDEHFQTVTAEKSEHWSKRAQFYLKQAKHKFACEEHDVFLIDEARALRANGERSPSLTFSKEPRRKSVTEPTKLSANQALSLHQLYSNKCNKLNTANEAYTKFISLLTKHGQQPNAPKEFKFSILNLSPEERLECRQLYNVFQPYFINSIPGATRREVLDFDRALVHAFTKKQKGDDAPSLTIFHKYDEYFKNYLTKTNVDWNRQSRIYLNLAEEKFAHDNKIAPLNHGENADRAHYLIKHRHYSNFVYEFRKSLQQLTSRFNTAMQTELALKSTAGVPYPELEDKYLAPAQCKQVLAIKEVYNGLYRIEQLLKKVEELNDKSHKAEYIFYLIQAYSQINELNKLSKSLAQDEHLKLISGDLFDKAQNLWATIQENKEPYQEAAIDVAPLGKEVGFSGLWYSLNAFNIIPKHIRSLRNASTLIQDDLDKLHVNAKRASLSIEAIMDSSDSYFKLFLQAPTMLRLFLDFKNQLNELISTVHDTATSNLGQLNSKIFTPMQLEADKWEEQLGLAPGTISGPLKNMLEEYYKGLLHPLKLPSKTHIEFICDKTPIATRKAVAQQKVAEAEAHLITAANNYAAVIKLHELIKKHDKEREPKKVKGLMEEIKNAYKDAFPRLLSLKRHLNFSPPPKSSEAEKHFDAQLNLGLKEYERVHQLSGLRELIELSHAVYLGEKNTYTMKVNTNNEKLAYLNQLDAAQDLANKRYVFAYAEESFTKQCKELAYRHIGLQYTHKEYSGKLETELLRFKERIIETAINEGKQGSDINQNIKTLLIKKIAGFEHEHFAKYYKLDRIRVALAQFNNYFSMSSNTLYENTETIRDKSAAINELSDIAAKEHESIDVRIASIHQKVMEPNFSRIILKERQLQTFSFDYLKSCLNALLRIFGILPAKESHLRELQKASTKDRNISDLKQRFGLFAERKEKAPSTEASSLDTEQSLLLSQPSPH